MSGFCYNYGCVNDPTKRCSGCKMATYCSTACQKSHWTDGHKQECAMNRALQEMESKQAKTEDKERKEGKSNTAVEAKPRKTHCTGCGGKFKDDWLEVDQECPDCGYMTCESCSCHDSKGSCYCDNSNFGYLYCSREPRNYHWGKSGMYKGDYHPAKEDGYELNKDDQPEAFSKSPKTCNNCGQKFHLLKKNWRNGGGDDGCRPQ